MFPDFNPSYCLDRTRFSGSPDNMSLIHFLYLSISLIRFLQLEQQLARDLVLVYHVSNEELNASVN